MPTVLRSSSRMPRLALGLAGLGLVAACLFLGCRRNLQPRGIPATTTTAAAPPAGASGGSCPHHEAGAGCGMESGSGCSHTDGKEPTDPSQQVSIPDRPKGSAALAWALPDGWSEEAGSGLRIATLRPAKYPSIEVTIVALEGEVGGELANVNRWRGQIGLPPVDAVALDVARKKVASRAGEVVVHELAGPSGTGIIAGIVPSRGTYTWFIKLTGDTASLPSVKASFYRWIGGLRFGA